MNEEVIKYIIDELKKQAAEAATERAELRNQIYEMRLTYHSRPSAPWKFWTQVVTTSGAIIASLIALLK